MKVNIFHQPGSAKCRLCGSHDEIVDHLLTSCSMLAQSYYKKHHDAVALVILWELTKQGGLDIVDAEYLYETFMRFYNPNRQTSVT